MNTRIFLSTLAATLALGTTGSAQNLFPAGGNVGIGTTNPGAPLDVRGSVRVAGDLMIGDAGLSTRALVATARLDLSSGPNEDIYLNRLGKSRDVFVGDKDHVSNLQVSGRTTTTTLELTSDRNQKQAFHPVPPGETLSKLMELPITTWAYTNAPGVRHIGPMAQEFKAVFPDLGEDDRHLGAGDGIGVALAAIQDLYRLVQRQQSEIVALRREVDSVRGELLAARPESGKANHAVAEVVVPRTVRGTGTIDVSADASPRTIRETLVSN